MTDSVQKAFVLNGIVVILGLLELCNRLHPRHSPVC